MKRWERSKKVRQILDAGVDGWVEIYETRKKSGSYGPTPAETIPETTLTILSGHALLAESKALKWLTVVLAFLTTVLAVLTWRLAFPPGP